MARQRINGGIAVVNQRKAGALLGYANILVKNLVNLVYTPMLLRFVGQADYGVYQSTYSFVFSLTLLTFGFSQAYVRFYMQERAHGERDSIKRLNGMYLILYIIISLVALILGLIFAVNAGNIFSKGFTFEQIELARVLIAIMSVNIAMTLFSTVFDAYILAHERFTFQQSRQLLTTLMTPLIAFLLLNLGMGALGVAFAQLAVTLVLLVLNIRYAIGILGMRFNIRQFDSRLFKAIAAFSAWTFANQICDLINQNLPNVVLGALSGASAVAVFAIAVQIRMVFMSLSTTMSNVFTPLINRVVAQSDNNKVLAGIMTRVGRYQAILFCWVYGGFVILGQFFIINWAGPEYSDAYLLVLIMAAPLFFPLTQNTGIEIQRAKNRHKARSIAYLLMAVTNLVITAVLAGGFGYWAPVAGYVAYVILGCGIFMNWYYQYRIGLDMLYFWRHVIPPIICSIIVIVICYSGTIIFPVDNWSMFIVWGIIYTLLYAAFTFFLVAVPEERIIIKKNVKQAVLRRKSNNN